MNINLKIVTPAQMRAQRTSETLRKFKARLQYGGNNLPKGERIQYQLIVARCRKALDEFYANAL